MEYRVVAEGRVSDLPIQWHYFLVADRAGRLAVFAFTVESDLVAQFGSADEALVSTIEFAPSPGPIPYPLPYPPPPPGPTTYVYYLIKQQQLADQAILNQYSVYQLDLVKLEAQRQKILAKQAQAAAQAAINALHQAQIAGLEDVQAAQAALAKALVAEQLAQQITQQAAATIVAILKQYLQQQIQKNEQEHQQKNQ